MSDAYARAGVSQRAADDAVEALRRSLRAIDTGRPSRVVPLPGHYASVLRLDDGSGLALSTDTVGTKMVVAERLGRYDTIGIRSRTLSPARSWAAPASGSSISTRSSPVPPSSPATR